LKLGALEVNYPSQNTDTSGFFTLTASGLPSGTYNWRAKSPKFLSNSGTVIFKSKVQSSRSRTLDFGLWTSVEMGLMRAGDANNDNIVSTLDFNILKPTMGKSIGDPGYDDRADFTGDQWVNISDFNLLKVNF